MLFNCFFRDEFPMILVGNKSDLENERTVSTAEAEELGRKLRVSWLDICLVEIQLYWSPNLFLVNILFL